MALKDILHYPLYLFPFIAFYAWSTFIESQGQKPWGDWIFAETAHKGAIYTIFNNLKTFQFLNQYAYQHWKQLFILNFNWIYWLTVLTGLTFFLLNKKNLKNIYKNLLGGNTKTRTLLIIIIFSIAYFFSVLTFQTYTIPRYALPLIPFLLLGTAFSIKILTKKFQVAKIGIVILFPIIVLVSLFSSIDPVSTKLWGKTEILGEKLYSLHQHLAGNDGITYNMQYLLIVKERTRQIASANNQGKKILGEKTDKPNESIKVNVQTMQKQSVISPDCYWVFPDPNNDFKMVKILNLNIDLNAPCITSLRIE